MELFELYIIQWKSSENHSERHYENYSVILKFSANIIILSARTFLN